MQHTEHDVTQHRPVWKQGMLRSMWEMIYNNRYLAKVQQHDNGWSLRIEEEGQAIHQQVLSKEEANNHTHLEQLLMDIIDGHEMSMIPEEYREEDRGGIEARPQA